MSLASPVAKAARRATALVDLVLKVAPLAVTAPKETVLKAIAVLVPKAAPLAAIVRRVTVPKATVAPAQKAQATADVPDSIPTAANRAVLARVARKAIAPRVDLADPAAMAPRVATVPTVEIAAIAVLASGSTARSRIADLASRPRWKV